MSVWIGKAHILNIVFIQSAGRVSRDPSLNRTFKSVQLENDFNFSGNILFQTTGQKLRREFSPLCTIITFGRTNLSPILVVGPQP